MIVQLPHYATLRSPAPGYCYSIIMSTSSNNDDETSIQVVKKQDDSRFSDESKSEFKKEDSNLENIYEMEIKKIMEV